MKRRGFVKLGAMSAALGSVPAFIARAFAQDACEDDSTRIAAAASAYRRARATGRPLLVLVVPETEDMIAYERQHAFGEWLNHGGDETLAMLALTEVFVGRMSHVRRVLPSTPAEDAVMLLVETSELPSRVVPLRAELPNLFDGSPWAEGMTWEERERRDEARIDERVAILTSLLRGALVPDAATISRRVAQAESVRNLEHRAAVHYARAMASSAETRASMLHDLAERARERLVGERVPGSRWARSSGCGTTIEGEEDNIGVACGMGHVPARSVRFLYFYESLSY
jgi:hypothetical protein